MATTDGMTHLTGLTIGTIDAGQALTYLPSKLNRPVVITSCSQVNFATGTGVTKVTWKTTYPVIYPSNGIQLTFDWFYGRESVPANSVDIKAAIEYPANSGNIYPVYFSGKRVATIEAGGTLTSDIVGVNVAFGNAVQCRVLTDFTNYGTTAATYLTGKACLGTSLNAPMAPGLTADDGSIVNADNVDSGGTFVHTPGQIYGPTYITAVPTTQSVMPPVLLIGDSITAATTGAAWNEWGYAQRALQAAGVPYICIAVGGERASGFAQLASRVRRMRHLFGCYAAYVNFGTNDITLDFATAATVFANLQTIYAVLAQSGITKIVAGTITPCTTSTDGWITVANQSQGSFEAARVTLNNQLRTRPLPLVRVFDVASAVEVNAYNVPTVNGGYWHAAAQTYTGLPVANGSNSIANFVGTSFTPDALRTQLAVVTAGTNAGQAKPLFSNTATQFVFNGTFTGSLDNTSVITLNQVYSNDGTHPAEVGYQSMSNVFDVRAFM